MRLDYSVEKPLNREPPMRELVRTFITDASTAYDRNHGPLPHIDAESFRLQIGGAVAEPLELSVDALRSEFEQHEVVAALQCAGNRRHTMRTKVKEVDGLDWNDGAACNCTWRGPLLADVLARARPTAALQDQQGRQGHVHFNCYQTDVQDDDYYGSSVPLARCLDRSKQVILALDMNGAPLTVNHGFPLRAVIPGIAGARWTKWLDRIAVQPHESANFYMQRDYKILPPCVVSKAQAAQWWPRVPPIMGMPINSVVAYGSTVSAVSCPEPRTTNGTAADNDSGKNGDNENNNDDDDDDDDDDNDNDGGAIEVCGYALPQDDDGPVVAVDVSTDGGASWRPAVIVWPPPHELDTPQGHERYRWAWAIWKHRISRAAARRITPDTRIWSRATDAAGNRQDASVPWNYRGVAYNAYGETAGLHVLGPGDNPLEP